MPARSSASRVSCFPNSRVVGGGGGGGGADAVFFLATALTYEFVCKESSSHTGSYVKPGEELRAMDSAAAVPTPPCVSPSATLRIWALHLIAFSLPLYTLAFSLTGPHRWYAALPWLGAIPVLVLL